jgi:hypothetical protein
MATRTVTGLAKIRHDDRGVTLIETMMAAAILMIAVVGLLNLFTMAVRQNEQQGNIATRTTVYGQDKMEQLLRLDYADGATDTTVFPVSGAGGTGLGGAMTPNSTVGSIPPAAPVSQYVDYFDGSGNLLTGNAGATYTRQWSISSDASGTLKTITVVVSSNAPGNQQGTLPSTAIVCGKSSGL